MRFLRPLAVLLGGLVILTAAWLALGGAATAAPSRPAPTTAAITHTVTLTPLRDNTLYESSTGTLSNGAGRYLFAGTTARGAQARRGLLAFDLGAIPPGATILSATLTLNMSRTIAGESAVALHALTADWGEGASAAGGEEGGGAPPAPGDATWIHTFFDTATWAQPGGDFAPTPSAVTMVSVPGAYSWASPALLADIVAWLADPAANSGWALLGDESAGGTAKRFDSRENDPANRPRLAITYTVEGEPPHEAFVPVVAR